MTDVPRTARERARLEITAEITATARRHLAEHGAASLSLRAVARDVGMVSSAVYRYFPSRDELLTSLIVDAYTAMGESATEAERSVRRVDLLGRWLAIAGAVRSWARAHPHEHALIFGSPVPGYAAPPRTVDPAAVVPLLLIGVLADAQRAGASTSWAGRPLPRAVRTDLRALRRATGVDVDDAALRHGLLAWTLLVGAVGFELFGHLHHVIEDHDAYFEDQMRNVGIDLGLAARRP